MLKWKPLILCSGPGDSEELKEGNNGEIVFGGIGKQDALPMPILR